MSTVDELYRRYVNEYREAGDADPRTYLDELRGVDRAELAARINRFLDNAPPPSFDAEAFAKFRADPKRQALVARILESETLVELRTEAGESKRAVAEALAERLGLTQHAAAVRARYHDIETGNVDPGRVRSRVWDTLAEILRAPAERLREAAECAFSAASGQTGRAVFARSSRPAAVELSKELAPVHDSDDAAVNRVFFQD